MGLGCGYPFDTGDKVLVHHDRGEAYCGTLCASHVDPAVTP